MTAAPTSEPFLFTPGGDAGSATGSDSRRPGPGGETSDPTSPEALVHQARLEISQIVREVAGAQRTAGSRDRYLRFLSDRVLRAMAAHGVVVWQAVDEDFRLSLSSEEATNLESRDAHFLAEHRIGTVTDRQFDETESAVHDRLLIEIAGHGEPTVVPPTPGATDQEVPANPASHPAAIVPILVDPNAALPNCLIEVFLEPGGSPASQRGSLRFLAQMGDLAGEFLRTDQLRTQSRRIAGMEKCVRAIDALQSFTTTSEVESAWVDTMASMFEVPRVALCRVDRGRPKVVAVSHVERIDHHSEAAERIRKAAALPLASRQNVAVATLGDNGAKQSSGRQDERREGNDRRKPTESKETSESQPVQPLHVVSLHSDARWRLVILDRPGSSKIELTSETLALLERLLIGGEQAWMSANRVESVPGGKWWTRFNAPTAISTDKGIEHSVMRKTAGSDSPLRRSLVRLVAVAVIVALVLIVPIPLTVPATGVIRPLEVDRYHSSFDATVQSIEVRHGQEVSRGDVLAKLHSRDLTEQQTTLIGRRSVLGQRRDQLNRNLMSATDSDKLANPTGGDEIDEEIESINQQLAIIAESLDRLVLRARRDGRVDAWRISERMAHRPLRRGDAVLNVIADDSEWVVDATVAQSRVQSVNHAIQTEAITAEVSTRWSPDESQTATTRKFGPVVTDSVDGTRGVVLRMNLSSAPKLGDQPLAETPARVSIRCGETSVGRFLFADFVTWVRTRVGMYL